MLGLMALKFVMVAALFMHLKFDNKLLTRLFYGGLFLAVGVYVAALATFELFG
jgi:cytochrome c oxidase subunit 4